MSRFARRIRPRVLRELAAARAAERRGDPARAFRHLERAHVLGQESTPLHVIVHARMFVWGWRQRRPREIVGQLWRLTAAATKTPIGLLPHGNTGGANVSGLRPMPVAADLQRAIDRARG